MATLPTASGARRSWRPTWWTPGSTTTASKTGPSSRRPQAGRAGGKTAGTPGTITTICRICCSSGASTRPPTAGTTPRSTTLTTAGTTGTDPKAPHGCEEPFSSAGRVSWVLWAERGVDRVRDLRYTGITTINGRCGL